MCLHEDTTPSPLEIGRDRNGLSTCQLLLPTFRIHDLSASCSEQSSVNDDWSVHRIQKAREKVLDRFQKASLKYSNLENDKSG
ncbi:hypothetical protein CDAR_386751 [Caerostris darwini]|uniref:Uncharacterized protein n=1 Tax=Caerostris darwini TaxID=1538125 RepID=A0AAV4UER3_9ARAC|nr:hypothetical protein CDAR_386751 [Caerostris darwini]